MREQISNVIYGQKTKGRSTVYYDWFIMLVAIASVVPMMFRGELSTFMQTLESITVYILFFDYILRWMTHDFRMKITPHGRFSSTRLRLLRLWI